LTFLCRKLKRGNGKIMTKKECMDYALLKT